MKKVLLLCSLLLAILASCAPAMPERKKHITTASITTNTLQYPVFFGTTPEILLVIDGAGPIGQLLSNPSNETLAVSKNPAVTPLLDNYRRVLLDATDPAYATFTYKITDTAGRTVPINSIEDYTPIITDSNALFSLELNRTAGNFKIKYLVEEEPTEPVLYALSWEIKGNNAPDNPAFTLSGGSTFFTDIEVAEIFVGKGAPWTHDFQNSSWLPNGLKSLFYFGPGVLYNTASKPDSPLASIKQKALAQQFIAMFDALHADLNISTDPSKGIYFDLSKKPDWMKGMTLDPGKRHVLIRATDEFIAAAPTDATAKTAYYAAIVGVYEFPWTMKHTNGLDEKGTLKLEITPN
jgi:hypothetical protein